MGGSFKIGRFSGIDVRVHWTFLLLLAFFAFVGYQNSGNLAGALTPIAVIVALFICVLLHEFGHSLVAQRLGIVVRSITLLPIGGVSNLETLPEKPADEVKITLAGPLVNVVLAPIFFGVGLLLGAEPRMPTDPFTGIGSVGQFFFYLGYLNVVLAVFNLIPAFPLDGGRVFRGLLATRLGALRATDIAARVGQLFAAAFFLIGFFGGNFLLALIGVFIFFGASGEAQMVRQRELTSGLTVSDVMGTKGRTETVTPYHTFGQVLDSVIHGYQEDFPVVDQNGKLLGMITREEIIAAAHSPERYASKVVALQPRRTLWRLADVIGLVPETPRTKSLLLEVPGWKGHKAGQHVDVRLTAPDGYQTRRSYSIASAPEDERLVLTTTLLYPRRRSGNRAPTLISGCEAVIARATAYSRKHFEDPPEISDCTWTP